MSNSDVPVNSTDAKDEPRFAGFWRRALAFVIDVFVVSLAVSALLLLLASVFPGVGRMVELSTPFDIGTVERTVEDKSTETTDAGGGKTTHIDKTVERVVLGRWVYRYRIEGQKQEYPGELFVTSVRTSVTWRIDPETGEPMDSIGANLITFVVLMLYWIAADASRYRGSLGKRALGIAVVDGDGQRLHLVQAAGRNLLKVLSAVPVFIGFVMAGWTKRKQALHDLITGSYLIARR